MRVGVRGGEAELRVMLWVIVSETVRVMVRV